jgi:uncharacterized glyoxalase superfamily protein PhnB
MNYASGAEDVWTRMVDNGFDVMMPFEKQFWGTLYGRAVDPFGHTWALHQDAPAEGEKKDDEHQAKVAKTD